jgi:hypothetical protein
MKLRLLIGTCAVLALGVWTAAASADPVFSPLCQGTETVALSGTYKNLTITGDNNYVASGSSLTVTGNLVLTPGSCLDAFSLGTVTVGRNITVEPGAVLALGCTPFSNGLQDPCEGQFTNDTVGGNITAYQPLTMYLDGDTISGNVTSQGGGPGLGFPPFLTFPVKDNTIGGNLVMEGWQGGWAGAIRDKVGKNLIFSDNQSALDPDSNEVATNMVSGNLICSGNSPAAQLGDSGGSLNNVGGKGIDQCSSLVAG